MGFIIYSFNCSPLSDMAVIQGRNGAHVEIDLTDSSMPMDSVELTEATENMVRTLAITQAIYVKPTLYAYLIPEYCDPKVIV